MQQNIPTRLSELLISRLCHDLVTPIGAINTGLELFQETSSEEMNESKEILNLIYQSGATASSRISFFRAAFGANGDRASFDEARQLIERYFDRSKMDFNWENGSNTDLSLQGWGRIILNSTLWLCDCAPKGGALYFELPKENNLTFAATLKAESIIIHQGTLEAIQGEIKIDDVTPRSVPCYLVQILAKEKDYSISVQRSNAEIKLEISRV